MDKRTLTNHLSENYDIIKSITDYNLSFLNFRESMKEEDDSLTNSHGITIEISKGNAINILRKLSSNQNIILLDDFTTYHLRIFTTLFPRIEKVKTEDYWLLEKQMNYDILQVSVKILMGNKIVDDFKPNVIPIVEKSVLFETSRGILTVIKESLIGNHYKENYKKPDEKLLLDLYKNCYHQLYSEILGIIFS